MRNTGGVISTKFESFVSQTNESASIKRVFYFLTRTSLLTLILLHSTTPYGAGAIGLTSKIGSFLKKGILAADYHRVR